MDRKQRGETMKTQQSKDTLAACGFILQEDANGVCRLKSIATTKDEIRKRYSVWHSAGKKVNVSIPDND